VEGQTDSFYSTYRAVDLNMARLVLNIYLDKSYLLRFKYFVSEECRMRFIFYVKRVILVPGKSRSAAGGAGCSPAAMLHCLPSSATATNPACSMLSDIFSTILTGITFGLSMFGAGFCLGVIRVLVVAPALGNELTAVFLEFPLITFLCWRLSTLLIRKLHNIDSTFNGFIMGVCGFTTLLLCEVGLSLLVFDKSLKETLQDFATTKGRIGLAGQAISSSFPVWQLKLKRKERVE
jgi:hypothetical protein